MSRDDSMLYSGLTAPKKREAEKKKEETQSLDKRAEQVLDEIAKLKHEVSSTERILHDDSLTPEQQLIKLNDMRLEYSILNKLEKRMKTILGVKS